VATHCSRTKGGQQRQACSKQVKWRGCKAATQFYTRTQHSPARPETGSGHGFIHESCKKTVPCAGPQGGVTCTTEGAWGAKVRFLNHRPLRVSLSLSLSLSLSQAPIVSTTANSLTRSLTLPKSGQTPRPTPRFNSLSAQTCVSTAQTPLAVGFTAAGRRTPDAKQGHVRSPLGAVCVICREERECVCVRCTTRRSTYSHSLTLSPRQSSDRTRTSHARPALSLAGWGCQSLARWPHSLCTKSNSQPHKLAKSRGCML
jgi:hypothetical protein